MILKHMIFPHIKYFYTVICSVFSWKHKSSQFLIQEKSSTYIYILNIFSLSAYNSSSSRTNLICMLDVFQLKCGTRNFDFLAYYECCLNILAIFLELMFPWASQNTNNLDFCYVILRLYHFKNLIREVVIFCTEFLIPKIDLFLRELRSEKNVL